MVDAVQYDQRRINFDFDMIENRWDQSLSPGNEQAFYWGSAAAGEPGSRNYMGMRSPAADAMIAALLEARERSEFVAAVRALDRVLMSGIYVIPLLPPAGPMGGAVGGDPPSRRDLAVRLPARDMVARTVGEHEDAIDMGRRLWGGSQTLNHIARIQLLYFPRYFSFLPAPPRYAGEHQPSRLRQKPAGTEMPGDVARGFQRPYDRDDMVRY